MQIHALLVWNPDTGLCDLPVAALGVDGPVWFVEWIRRDHTADPWRAELYGRPENPPALVGEWTHAEGTRQLHTCVLPEQRSLRDQVAAAADRLVTSTGVVE